jgi:hypothetical protein
MRIRISHMLLAVIATAAPCLAGTLSVVSVEPALNALQAPTNSDITIHFNEPVNRSTVTPNSFWAFARWSGTISGQFSYTNNDQTVTLHPDKPFSNGELVMVILSHDLQAAGGSPFRSAGYSYQFWTRARVANMSFQQVDVLDTNLTGSESSVPYGGVATDYNNDGWLDLSLVNEVTADLRTFLNTGDGLGNFGPIVQPTAGLGFGGSPSEPADFNHDGNADICVANQGSNTLSVLLGNGDGTFAPQQVLSAGATPSGIAVLDADGDGDIDIVNTNRVSGNLSVFFNNGSGVFGTATFFDAGGDNERSITATDMDNDGILDLVVGTYNGQSILVDRGNGDGTFTHISTRSGVGFGWMLVAGDVNGDGNQDIAQANSNNNNGAILLGDGNGNLGAPQMYGADSFPLATDLADLDGDGDLDWITSAFGGDWFVFRNNGSGTFTFDQEMFSPQAASCSIPLDMDNDGDLDLALVDEIADLVLIMKNNGTAVPGDATGDAKVDLADTAIHYDCLAGPDVSTPPPGCTPTQFDNVDADGDFDVDLEDYRIMTNNVAEN